MSGIFLPAIAPSGHAGHYGEHCSAAKPPSIRHTPMPMRTRGSLIPTLEGVTGERSAAGGRQDRFHKAPPHACLAPPPRARRFCADGRNVRTRLALYQTKMPLTLAQYDRDIGCAMTLVLKRASDRALSVNLNDSSNVVDHGTNRPPSTRQKPPLALLSHPTLRTGRSP